MNAQQLETAVFHDCSRRQNHPKPSSHWKDNVHYPKFLYFAVQMKIIQNLLLPKQLAENSVMNNPYSKYNKKYINFEKLYVRNFFSAHSIYPNFSKTHTCIVSQSSMTSHLCSARSQGLRM